LQALDHLPPDEQTLVNLFYYDDLPLRDIAYIVEAPPGTIATRLHRIRQKLYHLIQKNPLQ
ncbi:MAG: RNA polymerase subunit sigma-70, partial [Bacteroidaceae bacterium]|nr:RNA polymerase subunit sigma-70 [Bacteroidaceae bacterium]